MLPTGILCSYSADRFEVLNASCLPTSTYNEAITYCRTRRNVTDVSCIIAACGSLMTTTMATGRYIHVVEPRTYIINPNLTDVTPVRIVHALRQFIIENRPDLDGGPLPRPIDDPLPRYYNTTEVGVNSFQVSARNFAREGAAFIHNFWYGILSSMMPLDNYTFIRNAYELYSVFTPSRCPDPEVANIAWLQGNDINLRALQRIGVKMMVLEVVGISEWPMVCNFLLSTDTYFCAAFESGYYAYESLTNYSMLPSPFRDITAMYRANNNEWPDCGAPVGCFGYTGPAPP